VKFLPTFARHKKQQFDLKVYHSIEEIKQLENPVATIGTFDGVHLGHRVVIGKLIDLAKKHHTESLLITFEPHPRIVLNKDARDLRFINNPSEKIKLLANTGIDHLLILPFTYEFSTIVARDFIQNYLIDKLHVQAMIVGYDHHFGHMDERDEDVCVLLNDYGIDVERIPEQDVMDVSVSSTKIRQAIKEGDIPRANKFLSYRYGLCGTVIHGTKVGRTIGFPTANLMMEYKLKLLQQDGDYAAWVNFKEHVYPAMLNIGFKPSVKASKHTIEVHILNFNQLIYGEYLEVELVKKIRDEKHFQSLSLLKNQLEEDRIATINIIKEMATKNH
jgi:riboflavin kinase/FMN adenylyltransferase